MKPDYQLYATLLDSFSSYLDSDLIWERYWGMSEEPPHTADEFRDLQRQALLDRINRVPFDSEAADRGTAFNELVDCLVQRRKPAPEFRVTRVYEQPDPDDDRTAPRIVAVKAAYNGREFSFDIALLREFAAYYPGAIPQQFVSATLPTPAGCVRLYGYIDELMPLSVHDIKTTASYSVGKYKRNWQHLVYPYCLMQSGSQVRDFEYNVAQIDRYGRWETFTESYRFDPDRDVPRLAAHCAALIQFLNDNRALITDRKIFNLPTN